MNKLIPTLISVVCFLGAGWAWAQPSLDYTAANDPDGGTDNIWEDAGSSGLNFTLGTGVTYNNSPVGAPANVTAVYSYDGTVNATGSGYNIQSFGTDPTNNNASFEILFRPTDNFGKEVLWETGHTTGSSMSLNGNELQFVSRAGASTAVSTINPGGIATSPGQYVHAVGVIDLANDQYSLYVNGALVDGPASYTPGDWSGGDTSGLGSVHGNGIGAEGGAINLSGYDRFNGDIALFRVYESALTAGDVTDLYEAVGAFEEPTGPINLLSTTFNGRTVTGDTASDIPWVTNGIADPGNLTAIDIDNAAPPTFGLFDTPSAVDHFAPDLNVQNEGPWSVDIPLTLVGSDVEIIEVELDRQNFGNTGGLSGVNRQVDWTASLIGSVSGLLDMASISVNSGSGIDTITFNSPLTLSAAETWTLRIEASSQQTSGINAGLDGINVIGNILEAPAVVPEPASVAIWSILGLGMVGFGYYRVRRKK